MPFSRVADYHVAESAGIALFFSGFRFPLMAASLVSGDQRWSEFTDTPFQHAVKDQAFTVVFEVTGDMFFFDRDFKSKRKP